MSSTGRRKSSPWKTTSRSDLRYGQASSREEGILRPSLADSDVSYMVLCWDSEGKGIVPERSPGRFIDESLSSLLSERSPCFLSFFTFEKPEVDRPTLDGRWKLYRLLGAFGSVGRELLAAEDSGRWYSSFNFCFCLDRKWCRFSLPFSSEVAESMGRIVAEDEFVKL